MNLLNVLLQASGGAAAEGAAGSQYSSIIMIALLFVVFYFFMIRPQTKKQKELKTFREALGKGDKVVTTGGIYGKILDVKENHFLIEVDSNVKIKIDKAAILKDSSDVDASTRK